MKLKDFLKKLMPTWTKYEDLISERDKLLDLAQELLNINKGLNTAVGILNLEKEGLRHEAVTLLSAITFQHGGELSVKAEFFDVLEEPGNSNMKLSIQKQEDKSVILKLEQMEEEETES